jgi:hypothetical protein
MKKIIPFCIVYLSCKDTPDSSTDRNQDPIPLLPSDQTDIDKNKKQEKTEVPIKKERIVKTKEELYKLNNGEFEKLFEERIKEDMQEYLEKYKEAKEEIKNKIKEELNFSIRYMEVKEARHFYSYSRVTTSPNKINYENKIEILTKNKNAISILLEMIYINQNFYTIRVIEKFEKEINNLSEKDSYKLDLIFDHNESNLVYHGLNCQDCNVMSIILRGKNKEKVEDYINKINKINNHETDENGKVIIPNLD